MSVERGVAALPRRPFSHRARTHSLNRGKGMISNKLATLGSDQRSGRAQRLRDGAAGSTAGAARGRARARRRRPGRDRGERARPPVRTVQGQRRGEPQAQPAERHCSAATCATPTGSATTSPTNITPAERAAGEADLAALHDDRPRRRSTPPTSSPMTCSNIRPRTRCGALSRDMLALTAVRPINHFFGFHTFYPTLRQRQGRGAVQDARRL